MIYVGIDLGGMSAKSGVFKDGELILKERVDTDPSDGAKGVAEKLAALARSVVAHAGLSFKDVQAVGIGSPGVIDSASGTVVKWGNYDWVRVPLAGAVADLTGKRVYLTNDANAAALGEAKFGVGSEYRDCILVTLGTGVGGGIVLDGKLFEGFRSAGGEVGHMVIKTGGRPCGCGRQGCFEQYSSATALIRDTKRAMIENVDSEMWQDYTPDTVDGLTAFSHAKTDRTAAKIIENYENNLVCGLVNLANIFRPDVIMLGGGIANQGENLTKPVQKKFDSELFAHGLGVAVPIVKASLGNKAGVMGAAAYAMDEIK